MDLDTELRTTMARRADEAPASDGLMQAVLRRERRQRRRRLLGGLAVVLVVALGGAAFVTRPEENRTLRITDGAVATVPPAPISVGWFPAGLRAPRVLYLGTKAWSIDALRWVPRQTVSVRVTSIEPPRRSPVTTVDVGGAPATLYWAPSNTSPSPFGELTFERKPGQWVSIVADNAAPPVLTITVDDLVRVAESITDEPSPVEELLRMTVPDGTKVGRVIADDFNAHVGFIDAGTRPAPVALTDTPNLHQGGPRERLTVSVVARSPVLGYGGSKTESPTLVMPADVPPDGLYVAESRLVRFVLPVKGRKGAFVLLTVPDPHDPLASEQTLRSLAESVRLGRDVVLSRT